MRTRDASYTSASRSAPYRESQLPSSVGDGHRGDGDGPSEGVGDPVDGRITPGLGVQHQHQGAYSYSRNSRTSAGSQVSVATGPRAIRRIEHPIAERQLLGHRVNCPDKPRPPLYPAPMVP
ncbi:hypothetical protein ACFY5F_49480 [Streptomyces sp. NPDC013161]|uniref:hypothetical protein n=1 Tax=Streptomyces sp. NPDC013161 TaxID=3364862 RepID=UPI00369B6DE8